MAEVFKQILADEKIFNAIVRVAFNKTAQNKNGEIDRENLKYMMNKVVNDLSYEPYTNKEIDEVFDYLDSNKKGYLNIDDFKSLLKDILKLMIEELS